MEEDIKVSDTNTSMTDTLLCTVVREFYCVLTGLKLTIPLQLLTVLTTATAGLNSMTNMYIWSMQVPH